MFLICRKDTHIETGDTHFSWYGKTLSQSPFQMEYVAMEAAKGHAERFVESEKQRDPESVTVVSETEFIYNYFGATRVEFSVVEVKSC